MHAHMHVLDICTYQVQTTGNRNCVNRNVAPAIRHIVQDEQYVDIVSTRKASSVPNEIGLTGVTMIVGVFHPSKLTGPNWALIIFGQTGKAPREEMVSSRAKFREREGHKGQFLFSSEGRSAFYSRPETDGI